MSAAPIVPAKTRDHLQWQSVLDRLADHCRCPLGAEQARGLAFAADAHERALRLARVDEGRALLDRGTNLPIGQPPKVSLALTIAARGGQVEPGQLVAVGLQLESASRCRRVLEEWASDCPLLADVGERLADLPHLGRDLLDAFDENGHVVDSASGELGQLRGRVSNLHEQLKQRVHGLLADPEYADLLQDDYYTIREERYVLPIKAGHKRHVPGIVHGWSGSGQTVYIEPQAVCDSNNRLLLAQAEVDREIFRILKRLGQRVGQEAGRIRRSQDALATLDLVMASAALSKELDCHPPIVEPGPLALKQARHPLLQLGGVEVVPNDIVLGDGHQALVLTGPNTGGKTVALKTAGLCALMALAGLHIPAAAGSRLPPFPGIFTDIGDEQSLEQHKSTFSGHIANLLEIMEAMQRGCLVLLDELVVGTDPLQGAALAQSILEGLADRGSILIVTTHYETLKVLPFDDPRFRNGAVGFDGASGRPTYHLQLDIPGSSSALQTARRLGLDSRIVDRAAALAGPQQQRLHQVIEQLEAQTAAALKARDLATRELAKATMARETADRLEARLRKRLAEGLSREQDAALKQARAARDTLAVIKKQLRDPARSKDLGWITKTLTKTERLSSAIADARDSARAKAAGPVLPRTQLKIGQKVWVVSLGTDAVLTRLPDAKGRCEVRAGIMSAQIKATDLRAGRHGPALVTAPEPITTSRARAPAAERRKGPVDWDDAPPQVPDNTVDVRGERADAALDQVEAFLDAQLGRESAIAFIIHGHGTGALKRALREWLKTCRYVREQRRGERGEGGDGVTAVLLR